jgi:2-oxoglutarate ferredoxin oxidoreductase subunit alpha
MGIPTDSMRIRAVPFTDEVGEFIRAHERNYVVEMNRDGQMHQLLTLDYRQQAMQLISVAYTDGLPMTARRVRESILAKEMK